MKALFNYQELATLRAQEQQASFTKSRARKPLCFSHEDEGRVPSLGQERWGSLRPACRSRPCLLFGKPDVALAGWKPGCENAPQTCKSFVLAERLTALQAL